MNYHLNGIKQYISLKESVEHMLDTMTMKIFEVEDEVVSVVLPELLVIGYVTSVIQHPNADKLKVCQVDCGSHGVFQICTGGENVAENHYVPVALPGCYLPAIDLKIEPRPMRGEESNGMICSKDELGIPEDMDKHWIWLLDEDIDDLTDADVGKSMKDMYPWMENTRFEVKNIAINTRPDLTGYRGVACELNAVYADSGKIQFNHVPVMLEEIRNTHAQEVLSGAPDATRSISIDTEGCSCYHLVELQHCVVKHSDLYHRCMIYSAGSTPKNNWVDWSNTFMNLTGQPVHCFDSELLVGGIIVRTAEDGEVFVDLTGASHALESGDIVICDQEKIIALAGVIGGQNSCISNSTTHISIEVAQFDPTQIRKTATRLGLRTDAAVRFEKYINPHRTQYCSLMIPAHLRKNLRTMGEFQYIGISDAVTQLPARSPISISISKAQQFIRANHDPLDGEAMKAILEHLGFAVSIHDDVMTCMSPIWRSPVDITHAQDIYEEIARIVGYETITSQGLKTTATPQLNPLPQLVRQIEDILVLQHHYDQVETYLWTEEKYLKLLGHDHDSNYRLLNPLSPEQTIIRSALYPGLVKIVVDNHRLQDDIHIMETAHVMHDGVESHHVCWVSYVKNDKNLLNDQIIKHKNILSDIVGQYEISSTDKPYLHPTKQGDIIKDNHVIGLIGQIHPLVCDELGLELDHQLVVTEINLDIRTQEGNKTKKSATSYLTNQHHIITRDVSFGLTGDATYEQVLSIARGAKGIDHVEVFDLYQPSEELKTIGVRFTMIYEEAPSTESVTKKVEYIIQQISKIEGVSVR